jgi:hypothetical protein
LDFPSLFSLVREFDECLQESEMLIVSKRYLDQVIEKRSEEQVILNFSDDQNTSHAGVESIYR